MVEKIHPLVAREIRLLDDKNATLAAELDRLAAVLEDERQARLALEKQQVHIDDMPGKQLPFKYQINIPLAGGSNSPQTGTVNISRDGPFIARRVYVSCIISDAPNLEPAAGTPLDYSDFVGRFVPISSRGQYFNWARDGAQLVVGTGTPPYDSFLPPPLDFEFEYDDGGSERNRQDKPISGDILTRFDEDGFFLNNEIFAAGTTISFKISPLREVPIVATGDPGAEVSGPINLIAKVTFDGFKVLQPLEM